MNIKTMPAGREMDELINKDLGNKAEYRCFADSCCEQECVTDVNDCIMADLLFKAGKKFPEDCKHWQKLETPPYSTDIAAAMSITDKWLSVDSGTFELNCAVIGKEINWHCQFGNHEPADAPTAPLAICRASLKALEV